MNKQSILIKGTTVHDGLGSVLEGYDVLIENGRFSEIGVGLSRPGCRIVEATGLEMFPGFVVPLSPWGGAGPVLGAGNLSEHSSLMTPEMNVTYAFQADSIAYQRLYQWGITASCLTPDFTNVLCGQSAVYKTYADSFSGYLLKEKSFMAASFSGKVKDIHAGKRYAETDMGLIHLFQETLEHAQVSQETSSAGRALSEITSGRMPLVICCDSQDMWHRVSAELDKYPSIRAVLCGVYGVGREDLEKSGRNIPCIQFSMADAGWNDAGKIDFGQIDTMLADGFLIAASPYLNEAEMSHAESVLWNAAVMYKNGVRPEHVVKSLCSIPAEILGVGDRTGSIAPGLDADFSLWTDHPVTTFEAQMKHVFIDGAEITERAVERICW